MSVKNARQTIESTVTSWEGVQTHPHRFGGRAFRLGTRELGHIHGNRLVDIPFPTKVRDELVANGEVERHHYLPDSGWVSFYLRAEEDVTKAIGLLERSYRLALKQKTRRETKGASEPLGQKLAPQPSKESTMSVVPSKPIMTFRGALVAGLTGGVIAAVINAVIYFAAQSVNGGPLLVQTPQAPTAQPLPVFAVLLFSIVPGILAGVVYWALARFTRAPARWFLILAVIVFGLFVVGPLGAASGVAVWALELMHVGAAVPIVWTLLRWHR